MKISKHLKVFPLYNKLTDDMSHAVACFNDKVDKGEVPFEEVPCLCENDTFSSIANIDRYGLNQTTVICDKCGLVQSNPRLTAEYYRHFYESDEYRRLYDGQNFASDYETLYTTDRGRSIFNSVSTHRHMKEGDSVMEVGAGGGWNLLPFIEAGFSVSGFDYSSELVELGKSKGVNLISGGLSDIIGTYDVIIANHVLEHFTDFLSDIKKIRTLLSSDGLLYVGVPNIETFSMADLQNAHTYYFTVKTLRHYMAQCGFKLIHSQPEARGQHMSCIFVIDTPQTDDGALDTHYEEMIRVLRKCTYLYNPSRFALKSVIRGVVMLMTLTGTKKFFKSIIKH